MDPTAMTARRATLEDVPALEALWQTAGLPATELIQFVQEFQVVTSPEGNIIGALGLLVEGSESLLHSEAIQEGVEADFVRASVWRRIQIVARNQGIQRVWTQEDAEFWSLNGFAPAPPEAVAAAKASFLDASAAWKLLTLTDPARTREEVQEQFAILKATQQQEAEAFQQRIKLFRLFAWMLALLVMAGCLALLLVLSRSDPQFFRKLLGH